jgi:hypothetical protein
MRVDEGAGSLMVRETVPRNYLFIFLPSRILGFLFAISNCTDSFLRVSNKEMKLETNVIAIII